MIVMMMSIRCLCCLILIAYTNQIKSN